MSSWWHVWGRNLAIGFVSLFFFVFGIENLIAAYGLSHPHEFIMVFFSSSLMILISLVGILYPFLQIRAFLCRRGKP